MPTARLIVIAWASLLAAAQASAGTLGLGTMPPGTLSHSSGAVIGRVLHQRLGLELRVQPHGGESVLMPLLDGGELDFAIASVVEAGDAFAGRHAFAGARQANLRIAAVLFPLRVALFVRADSDIHDIAGLAGRRLPSGFVAMASAQRLLAAVLANGGLGPGDVRPVLVPDVVKGAETFVNGRADAFFFAVGAARVREVDARVPLRMLPLAVDAAALARMQAVLAEGYASTVSPAPGVAGVSAPAPALAFDNLLLTGTHVAAETVTSVLATLSAHRDELTAGFAPFRELRLETLRKPGLPVPFHDGARRWQGLP